MSNETIEFECDRIKEESSSLTSGSITSISRGNDIFVEVRGSNFR
jgi:hypothetical protein